MDVNVKFWKDLGLVGGNEELYLVPGCNFNGESGTPIKHRKDYQNVIIGYNLGVIPDKLIISNSQLSTREEEKIWSYKVQ